MKRQKKEIVIGIIFLFILLYASFAYSQSRQFGTFIRVKGYDTDGDGLPNFEDSDDDNDGVPDTNDPLLGDFSYINTSTMSGMNMSMNYSYNMNGTNSTFNGVMWLEMSTFGNCTASFQWNFSKAGIDLYNITMETQTNQTLGGGFFMKGLPFSQIMGSGFTKNFCIDNVDTSKDSVCIKDAEINSMDEISAGCTGANETLVKCDGTTQSGYTCTTFANNTRFNITGLRFSGIEQRTSSAAAAAGPSGGGGGPSAPAIAPKIADFVLSRENIKVILKQGQSKKDTIKLKNTGTKTLLIGIDPQALKGIVKVAKPSVQLAPNEEHDLELLFEATKAQKPDVYVGGISISSDGIKKEILAIIELESGSPLFDVDVEVLPQSKKVFPGDEIFIELSLFNVRGFGSGDVNLEYTIKDIKGDIVASETETITVQTTNTFSRKLALPADLRPGSYAVVVKVTYEDLVGTSSDVLDVEAKSLRLYPLAIKDSTFNLLIVVIFLVVSIFLLLVYEFGVLKKPVPFTSEKAERVSMEEKKAEIEVIRQAEARKERIKKLEAELESLEEGYGSKFISESTYNAAKKKIASEMNKLR